MPNLSGGGTENKCPARAIFSNVGRVRATALRPDPSLKRPCAILVRWWYGRQIPSPRHFGTTGRVWATALRPEPPKKRPCATLVRLVGRITNKSPSHFGSCRVCLGYDPVPGPTFKKALCHTRPSGGTFVKYRLTVQRLYCLFDEHCWPTGMGHISASRVHWYADQVGCVLVMFSCRSRPWDILDFKNAPF